MEPRASIKDTSLKGFLDVRFRKESSASKNKLHWRKRNATGIYKDLRNVLQAIFAPSQLLEDFLKFLRLFL